MESDEIELIQIKKDNYIDNYCCICLNDTLDFNYTYPPFTFLKMNCCNQTLHKECFLEWIIHPVNKNYNYNNKFHCVICKTKINNFDEIISLGEFINYIQNNKNNKSDIGYYKNILTELYKNNIITTIMINSEDDKTDDYYTELNYCSCNIICVFFFLVIIMLLVGNLLVKN